MRRRGFPAAALALIGSGALAQSRQYRVGFITSANLETAAALGISIPQAVLLRADRVIP